MKLDKQLNSSATERPVKFQSHMIILNSNLTAWRLGEILQ